MRQTITRILILGLFASLFTTSVLADKANGPKAKFFAKYDKNKNGKIDDDEKEAIRKDFAANPDGDLKHFDTNKDGKLDDAEIAAIKPPEGKKKTEKSGKGKKSDESAAKTESSETTAKADTTDKK